MRVQITARHCDLSDTVRERAGELAEKLARFDPRVSGAELVFEEERLLGGVEGRLHLETAVEPRRPDLAHHQERPLARRESGVRLLRVEPPVLVELLAHDAEGAGHQQLAGAASGHQLSAHGGDARLGREPSPRVPRMWPTGSSGHLVA